MALQNDCYVYMKEVIANPMTWILGFYFAVDIGSKIKKKNRSVKNEQARILRILF